MTNSSDATSALDLHLHLQPQAMFNLPDAAGARIVCRSGCLWITLDGDLRDFVLEPGESFTTTEHRRALIYALKPSCMAVSSSGQAAPGRRRAAHGLMLEAVPS